VRLTARWALVSLTSDFSKKRVTSEGARTLSKTTCSRAKLSHVARVGEVHGNSLHCGFSPRGLASGQIFRLLKAFLATGTARQQGDVHGGPAHEHGEL
jgi:hypothetical protein